MLKQKNFTSAIILLLSFIIWTVAVSITDVKTIGPLESAVGFATINQFVHNLTGVNFTLYNITDWLGLVPFAVCFGFGVLGFIQLIKRKSILKVDYDILVLGLFYIVVIAVYLLFENVVINYRPVLINGVLEASYPSSTTMLTMCVMPTLVMQFNKRIKNKTAKNIVVLVSVIFMVFMVVGRILSGVHWISDIIGGALLSAGLVMLYSAVVEMEFKL
ncbi:MAG: phosphatase PAP2 family protein [Clostridia bacterium]|nr:phosphatase PAP2 family protein [Clostridia bacterium]